MKISIGTRILHIVALWSLAVVQPILDLLGKNAEFFVARSNTSGDILLMIAALLLVPAVAIAMIEVGTARLRPSIGWATHLVLAFLLLTTIFTQLSAGPLGGSTLAIPVGVALGAAGVVAYARFEAAKTALSVLSIAPIVIVANFVLLSPASSILLPSEEQATASSGARKPIPVVMVVFDEFPTATIMNSDGTLDEQRFPGFAELAEDATWYPFASTEAEQTLDSIPSILTGKRPTKGKLPTFSDHPQNLFTLLAPSHTLNVTEQLTTLCPKDLCERDETPQADRLRSLFSDLRVIYLHSLLPDALHDRLPSMGETWEGFGGHSGGAGEITQEDFDDFFKQDLGSHFKQFTSRVTPRSSGRPVFNFLHSGLPHTPWLRNPVGQVYAPSRGRVPGLDDGIWTDDPVPVENAFARHAMQAAYADNLLADLLENLKSSAMYANTLLIVTADHGVSFLPGTPRRDANEANIGAIAGVPLFVKLPRQNSGQIDRSFVRTIDIAPTVASILGIDVHGFDGSPLLESPNERSSTEVMREGVTSLDVSNDIFRSSLLQSVRLKDDVLTRANGAKRFLTGGISPELIGRKSSSVRSGESPLTVLIDAPAKEVDDVHSDYIPLEVNGEVEGANERTDLLIDLNGEIVAGTSTYREGNSWVFSTVLPWDRIVRGMNRVSVLVAENDGSFSAPSGMAPRGSYWLDPSGSLKNDKHALTSHPFHGFVEYISINAGSAVIQGWAATGHGGSAADSVIVLVNGREVGRGNVWIKRPGVQEALGGSGKLLHSGFEFHTSVDRFDCDEPNAGLSFFAVKGSRAGELTVIEDFSDRLSEFCEGK